MTADSSEPSEIVIRSASEGGETHVNLMVGKKRVSWLSIIPFTIRIGSAAVRMDGIGGVGTDAHHRRRGYSRRVLEAAVTHMRSGDAAVSMLYGIPDFYPKFGYATAGPDHLVLLSDLERDSVLPSGWSVRDFAVSDLPAMQAIYTRSIAQSVGAAVRPAEGGVWRHLTGGTEKEEPDACRVVLGPDGLIHGYVWRARWCWYVKHKLETDYRDALVLGEVMADDSVAADAVLAACQQWALAESAHRRIKQVVLAFPPHGATAAGARYRSTWFVQNYSACGSSMARVLDVTRLLHALEPELQARLRQARSQFAGALIFETELGDATLHIVPNAVTVTQGADSNSDALRVNLPQSELARLALGAFPPGDLLARLPRPPSEETAMLLENMFPLRCPHMYLPDRY